ncbi:MAG: 5-formyltetrahydrofolate cyclo-ligase, partial [Janthinobacterium lividum]
MPQYQRCKRLSIFMSMPAAELRTAAMVRHALGAGKEVYIPYIYKSSESHGSGTPASVMDMLQLRDMQDYASLKPDKWGIPSLDKTSVSERRNCFGAKGLTHGRVTAAAKDGLEVVLVPCVAFDRKLNRLGHGKGYYDSFLARYSANFSASSAGGQDPYL